MVTLRDVTWSVVVGRQSEGVGDRKDHASSCVVSREDNIVSNKTRPQQATGKGIIDVDKLSLLETNNRVMRVADSVAHDVPMSFIAESSNTNKPS
jgi:hypothetical protein